MIIDNRKMTEETCLITIPIDTLDGLLGDRTPLKSSHMLVKKLWLNVLKHD